MKGLKFDLPYRSSKPRENGLSNLVDSGYGLGYLEDVLQMAHEYVDIVKLGWASAYVTPNVEQKVKLFERYNIQTCPGGMLFELSCWQGKLGQFADALEALGITMVEVSNGSLPIPEKQKVECIRTFVDRGFTVLSEVGSKDVTVVSPPEDWIRCINEDMAAGAWKVIVEGRADASAGIYNADGTVKDDLIDGILGSGIPADRLIFEAPHKPQVSYFVNMIGTEVNLGNIPLEEIINVEALRLGLRGDTVKRIHGVKGEAGC